MDSLAVIQRLAGGEFLDRLAFALTEVSERVVVTGNKGKVSISLVIAQQMRGEPVVIIEETISTAPPASSPRGAMFYAIGDGHLERDDPRKPPLPGFRTVDGPDLEPRVIEEREVSDG